MSARITACHNPFTTQKTLYDIPAGTSIREEVNKCLHGRPLAAVVTVNGGKPIEEGLWDRTLQDEDHLTIRVIPGGGGAQSATDVAKAVILIVTFVAAAVLAPFTGGLSLLLAPLGIGLAVGLDMGANYLRSLFSAPNAGGYDTPENLPFLRGGRNRLLPFGKVPVVLGKNLVIPYYAAKPYTEIGGTDGADQYLRMLFVLG